MAEDYVPRELNLETVERDTLKVVDNQGRELLIMKAVRDENGEMVATERLNASIVTAAFKNVAERNGKIDLRFKVIIPETMLDPNWQIRLTPVLFMMGEKSGLEQVIITGEEYRKAQLRGYQKYEKFLESIITDSMRFIQKKDLELFISRNIPQLYKLKTDTCHISEERFESIYGVTEREALRHYTDYYALHRNEKRISMKDEMFRRNVKVPIIRDGLRLDTVIRGINGKVTYEYVQTIKSRPKLRKAVITLGGSVYCSDQQLYYIPRTDSLSFYISSLSSLVDGREKYRTKVIERRLTDNSVCWIDFPSGSSEILKDLGHNFGEIERIESNLRQIVFNEVYDLDSILVVASSSPEGAYGYNMRLSKQRSEAVCRSFERFVQRLQDSVRREEGLKVDLAGESIDAKQPSISFIPGNIAENWDYLRVLIDKDELLTPLQREQISDVMDTQDPDERERKMSELSCYRYLREKIYPRLRTVKFNFFLHRKGMVKDTVHTTELDSAYMKGVQLIRDRDYDKAIILLRPYHDFNTAVAYCALDYNESALQILEELKSDEKVEYMKALVYSRRGDDKMAVQSYLNACSMDPSFVHRGNLDPEISTLIKKYNLNLQQFEQ